MAETRIRHAWWQVPNSGGNFPCGYAVERVHYVKGSAGLSEPTKKPYFCFKSSCRKGYEALSQAGIRL